MDNQVFSRIEKKYLASDLQCPNLISKIEEYMVPDTYGVTNITSLYLDTVDRNLIARSIEQPLYKEKIRMRTYGDKEGKALMAAFLSDETTVHSSKALNIASIEKRLLKAKQISDFDSDEIAVFFELKKKYAGVVYKRRIVLSLGAALAFMSGWSYEVATKSWPLKNSTFALATMSSRIKQIAREISVAMKRAGTLEPSMGISCQRQAWILSDETGNKTALRITFDKHLKYFDCFNSTWRILNPAKHTFSWMPVIDNNNVIIEIKNEGPYPSWLVKALSENSLYPTSFTKYGTAYRLVMNRFDWRISC